MNINRIFLISFIVLILSSYQTDSSILFTLLMKLLMIKGALFMSMPLGIGAFVMGQGMGFFAGNMMGGYMMLRAANRYHNKEKAKWVGHSGWHGPPYYTTKYQAGYEKGKAIVDVINAGQQKFRAIGSIFKAFVPTAPPPPKYGPPKYGPPPPKYGPPGYDHYHSYGSYSDPLPTMSYGAPPATSYGVPPSESYGAPPSHSYGAPPSQSYGAPPSQSYGAPPSQSYGAPPPPSDMHGAGSGSGPMKFQDFLPIGQAFSAARKNAFSNSLLNSIGGGGGSSDLHNKLDEEKNRRSHLERPPMHSPSGFYTSAYGSPGQEFTGILTNKPGEQGDKYLRGEAHTADDSMNDASTTKSSVTTAPNEILESYLEQRLKAEAEKQKDEERKQEAQQLVQMLRKAYLKQLVESLKDEEISDKQKANRKLEASPFAGLISSSLENLLGSRDSRSIEHDQQPKNYNEAEAEAARQNTQNLIKDLLINEVFNSGSARDSSVEKQREEQSTSNKVTPSASSPLDNIDTTEVESITERVLSLSSAEREELVKGLEELGQGEEEAVITKPITRGDSEDELPFFTSSSSTENSVSVEEKKRDARNIMPAEWIPIPADSFEEMFPYGLRVRRQTTSEQFGSAVGVAAGASVEEQKQIQGFVDDIRKFFTLLSALDQDQCLQKLVCDVHTNEKDINTLSQYELNILTTFKLMKALMPEGEEDSSTKYRYAALVGETGQSMELCQQQYSPCQVSSSQIVQLGSSPQPTPDPNDAVAANPLMMNLANLQQQSEAAAAMASGGIMSTLPTTTTTSTTTTTTTTTVRPRTRIRTRRTTTTTTPVPISEEDVGSSQRRNYVESNQYHNLQQQRRRQQQQYFQHQQQYHRPAQYNRERPSHEEQGPPANPQGSNFFNYGDFSDFFRGMWSDTMMGGGRKRRRGQLPPQSQEVYKQYWPAEVMEEIGI